MHPDDPRIIAIGEYLEGHFPQGIAGPKFTTHGEGAAAHPLLTFVVRCDDGRTTMLAWSVSILERWPVQTIREYLGKVRMGERLRAASQEVIDDSEILRVAAQPST